MIAPNPESAERDMKLRELLAKAVAAYNSLPPVDRAIADLEQRRSFARGMISTDVDIRQVDGHLNAMPEYVVLEAYRAMSAKESAYVKQIHDKDDEIASLSAALAGMQKEVRGQQYLTVNLEGVEPDSEIFKELKELIQCGGLVSLNDEKTRGEIIKSIKNAFQLDVSHPIEPELPAPNQDIYSRVRKYIAKYLPMCRDRDNAMLAFVNMANELVNEHVAALIPAELVKGEVDAQTRTLSDSLNKSLHEEGKLRQRNLELCEKLADTQRELSAVQHATIASQSQLADLVNLVRVFTAINIPEYASDVTPTRCEIYYHTDAIHISNETMWRSGYPKDIYDGMYGSGRLTVGYFRKLKALIQQHWPSAL